MELNSVNSVSGIKYNSNSSAPEEKTEKNDELKNFSTVEYTSKNDGKTYIAKKVTLKQGDKELTGIYVFDKSAKPDEQGKIQGEFMSFDSFMEKMADELPAVDSSTAQAYFPNIKYTNSAQRT